MINEAISYATLADVTVGTPTVNNEALTIPLVRTEMVLGTTITEEAWRA